MLRVKACGLSDVGLTRAHNEDYFEIDPQHQLYVVADGMGGHSHGEVAAQIAVNAIREFVDKTADQDTTWPFGHGHPPRAPLEPAQDGGAHRPTTRCCAAISQDGSLYGMGTTVVGFLLEGSVAAVAHVGDSRAYRLRDGRLEQLTQDHTWVNEQVVAGFLSKEQARSHPLKNVVTRALGGESDVRGGRARDRGPARRPLPALLGRPDRACSPTPTSASAWAPAAACTRSAARWSTTPTPAAASTTSPWCCCRSRRRRERGTRTE